MPRLLTRMSTAGNCFTSVAATVASARSPGKLSSFASGTVLRIFTTGSSNADLERPLTITRQPSRARPVTMARPIPLVEPETRASLPDNCKFIRHRMSYRTRQCQSFHPVRETGRELTATDEKHLGRHHRHELDVCVQRQGR